MAEPVRIVQPACSGDAVGRVELLGSFGGAFVRKWVIEKIVPDADGFLVKHMRLLAEGEEG